MENITGKVLEICTQVAMKAVVALLIYFIGKMLIKHVLKVVEKSKGFTAQDDTLKGFIRSAIRFVLMALLIITIVSVLGIPMTSVIALLTSAGLAVGMALQGALGNLAGGIMLMVFKPFKVGDYVIVSDAEGFVKEITLFYTVFTTLDKKTMTVPNGNLMNGAITNNSVEPIRMVDMRFTCLRGSDAKKVQEVITEVMNKNEKILQDPAPFVSVSGATDTATEITVRPHCKKENYWEVFYAMNQEIPQALKDAGIEAPALHINTK